MSKSTHSNDEAMAGEREAAREAGDLRVCLTCGAENILDDPECPRDAGPACNIVTAAPRLGTDPS